MNTGIKTFFAGLLLAMACAAQSPVTLVTSVVPAPTINSITQSGATGGTQYCYWVVAVYTGGKSQPAGPLCTATSNSTLSASNYNIVTFTAPTSPIAAVSSYDLLRTTTANAPAGACACAVSTAQAGSPLNDQSNTLSAYTIATLAPSNLSVLVDQATAATTKTPKFVVDGTVKASFMDATGIVLEGNATDCGVAAGACTVANNTALLKIVTGTAAATSASPSTVAITGMPAFSATTSYKCFASNATTVANVFAPLTAGYVSTTAVTFTGPNTLTDTIRWACIGF